MGYYNVHIIKIAGWGFSDPGKVFLDNTVNIWYQGGSTSR
jgi:hypothetical protein